MLYDIPWESAGFSLIIWTGLFLGFLHSIMPCEEKAVFCFYAFGVARDWRQAFRIVNFYGAGLFVVNFLIGGIITYVGAIFGAFISIEEFRFVWNGIAAGVLILSGTIMLIQLKKKRYFPHSDQFQELSESLTTLRSRKRTAFLLGMLAAIPPCIFETAVYLQAISISVNYGWGNGTWTVFFFGIGTWLGLYPLTLVGTASGKISKVLKGSMMNRLQERMNGQTNESRAMDSGISTEQNNSIDLDLNEEKDETHSTPNITLNVGPSYSSKYTTDPEKEKKKKKAIRRSKYSRLEMFSAWTMIVFGVVFLLLAFFRVDIIPLESVPTNVPWPFPK